MRALKAILVAGGDLKRKLPMVAEEKLMLQALKNVNTPKFTANDVPLFNSIITDLFPGVETPKKDFGRMLEKMKEACAKYKILPKT